MIKYPYPEEELKDARDIARYFAQCYEQKNGEQLSQKYFSRAGGYVLRLKSQEDLSFEDLTLLIFGVFNTKSEIKSIGYIQYFIDKLDEYRDLKKQWEEQQEKEYQLPEYHEVKQEKKGDNPLEEFLQ